MTTRTRLVLALGIALLVVRPALADDPQPHPVPVEDPKPHGEPVKDQGSGEPKPHGEPVNPNPTPEPKPDQKPDAKPDQKPTNPTNPTNPKNPTNPTTKGPTQGPVQGPTQAPPGPPVPPPKPIPPPVPVNAKPLPATPPVKPEEIVYAARDVKLNGREKISDILVADNTKTTADTVILIARIEVGDDFTAEMPERIRHDLVSSGLFKTVEVYYDKLPGKDDAVRVHLLVKDKWSWVIAPAFYNQPTNTGGGLGYGENNLFGLNQKLLIYAQVATGDSFFVGAYQIPSIYGTRWSAQFDTYLANSRNIEYAPTQSFADNPAPIRESRLIYLNGGAKLGFELWHALYLNARIRAAHVGYKEVHLSEGASIMQVTKDPDPDPNAAIPAPGKEGWDISNEFDLSIDRRANWYGVQTGFRFGLSYEHNVLGSDFHYQEVGLGLFKAWQVLQRHNLVFKGNLQIGQDMPFQQEFLMGGTTMRGYLNNQFRGDLKALVNLEYSLPLFELFGFGVRGLGFIDSGYTTWESTDSAGIPTNPERNYLNFVVQRGLDPFRNSVGVGTRLYLRQIVLPLLGLDFGYGLEVRDFQVYLAIGLTD
jgi:outer membrane protein assembly factor BamA